MSQIEDAFNRIRLFKQLPSVERAELIRIARIEQVPSGKFLARKGDPVSEISFLISGALKLCEASPEGKEITIALLGPGAHVGVVSLLGDGKRTTDIIATCRSSLLCFDARVFEKELRRGAQLSYGLLVSVAQRLRETSRHLAESALYTLSSRLALRLLELAEVVELDGEERLLVRQRPSHQELANLLGASREAVTRALGQLEAGGHIRLEDNQVWVYSSAGEGA